jgi:hypothetical protein
VIGHLIEILSFGAVVAGIAGVAVVVTALSPTARLRRAFDAQRAEGRRMSENIVRLAPACAARMLGA